MESGVECYDTYIDEAVEQPEENNQVTDVCERGLGELVSFGKFSMNTLSWVRRSSFNHNQYQEEPGTCSMPGSVHQKKAYFEAYYKALAEKKALEKALVEGLHLAEGQNISEMGCETIAEQHVDLEQCMGVSRGFPSSFERELKVVGEGASNCSPLRNATEDGDCGIFSSSNAYPGVEDLREIVPPQSMETKEHIVPVSNIEESEGLDFVPNIDGMQETGETLENKGGKEDTDGKIDMNVFDKYELCEDLNHKVSQNPGVREFTQKKKDSKHVTGTVARSRPTQSVSQMSKVKPKSATVEGTLRTIAKDGKNEIQRRRRGLRTKDGKNEIQRSRRGLRAKDDIKVSTLQGSLSIGLSRSKFTVPQPFALATDKRAHLVEQLPEHDVEARTVSSGSVPAFLAMKKNQASGRVDQKPATAKEERLNSLDDSVNPKELEMEPKQSEDGALLGTAVVTQNGFHRRLKASHSKSSTNMFSFKSDARAEKRKEFNSKMEAKLSAKEAEKNQAEAKTQEQEEAGIRQLRKSLAFKATPMPNFYKESAPPKTEIKKIPPTRAKSPKLGRRNNGLGADTDLNHPHLCQAVDLNHEQKSSGISHKPFKLMEKVDCAEQLKHNLCFSKDIVKKGSHCDEASNGEVKESITSYSEEVAGAVIGDMSSDQHVSDVKEVAHRSKIPEDKNVNKYEVNVDSIPGIREEMPAATIAPSIVDAANSKVNRGLWGMKNGTKEVKLKVSKATRKEHANVTASPVSSLERNEWKVAPLN